MKMDYLKELKYMGLISRLKRLSENTVADGRKLYQFIDMGIEPNWFLVFRIIQEQGETSISEITTLLKFAHPSVISIVKKMEKAGYLDIEPSKKDKRKQIIRLSKKGKQEMPNMQKVWQASELAIASVFKNDNFLKELESMEMALEEESFFDRVLNNLSQDSVKIVPFTEKDGKLFASLNKDWLNRYFIVEPIDKIVLNNPKKHIIQKDGHILMAKYRDVTAGTVALLPKDKSEIELCRMAVDPAYQKRGLGGKLMQKAIEVAREHSYQTIFLYSNLKLESALSLYKKFGFKEEKLEANAVYDRADIKMRLNLNE